MSHKRIKRPIQRMRIEDIKTEEGSEELLQSPAMAPYMQLAVASLKGEDLKKALAEIAALPLEQRYVWRIASALKWAFADFDNLNVAADRETLRPEDRETLTDLLSLRPIQFCLFLQALVGEEAMEQMMTQAIIAAKALPRGM